MAFRSFLGAGGQREFAFPNGRNKGGNPQPVENAVVPTDNFSCFSSLRICASMPLFPPLMAIWAVGEGEPIYPPSILEAPTQSPPLPLPQPKLRPAPRLR